MSAAVNASGPYEITALEQDATARAGVSLSLDDPPSS